MNDVVWNAIVLAASRGETDPITKHYGLAHKCLLNVAGVPMLARVIGALRGARQFRSISVSIESADVISQAIGEQGDDVKHVASLQSAPSSALAAAHEIGTFPILITTGDHALLTPEMVKHVCNASVALRADISVGLATREVIQAAYPETKRTYFRFRDVAVSGCNLFTVHSAAGLRLLELWSDLEKDRKRPWKLALAFGPGALFRIIFWRMTLADAFDILSRKCDMVARPLLLPYAEAAIDVDKPSDKDVAEKILMTRQNQQSGDLT
jgi:GTP:adenosylcobinamide-phosphate guanylyltransferase